MHVITCISGHSDNPNPCVIKQSYVSHFSEPIKDILKLLEKACNSADRRSLGFSAAEVAYGLSHVATNDGNKKTVCLNAS